MVKTDKSKRFGGYTHECFEKKIFTKKDINAFLFNLDKKSIYKSKGQGVSIWRGSLTFDSINFGTRTDLKRFHNYFKRQNKTLQTNNIMIIIMMNML